MKLVRNIGIGAVLVVVLLIVIGILAGPTTPTTPTAATAPGQVLADIPTFTATPAPTVPPSPTGPLTTFGEGNYQVGTDILPGTYHTTGPDGTNPVGCYWERAKDTSGDSIITNDIGNGPATVTISATDGAFKTSGCNTWNHLK